MALQRRNLHPEFLCKEKLDAHVQPNRWLEHHTDPKSKKIKFVNRVPKVTVRNYITVI